MSNGAFARSTDHARPPTVGATTGKVAQSSIAYDFISSKIKELTARVRIERDRNRIGFSRNRIGKSWRRAGGTGRQTGLCRPESWKHNKRPPKSAARSPTKTSSNDLAGRTTGHSQTRSLARQAIPAPQSASSWRCKRHSKRYPLASDAARSSTLVDCFRHWMPQPLYSEVLSSPIHTSLAPSLAACQGSCGCLGHRSNY